MKAAKDGSANYTLPENAGFKVREQMARVRANDSKEDMEAITQDNSGVRVMPTARMRHETRIIG